tara:strand:+ start:4672 stop:4845 length:174 start_codon:yes stop_codon:yes gene_type:complete
LTLFAWLFGTERFAGNGFENAKEEKAKVAEEMTKEQISESQKISREMLKANPKLIGD